jgi:hypothetical protein
MAACKCWGSGSGLIRTFLPNRDPDPDPPTFKMLSTYQKINFFTPTFSVRYLSFSAMHEKKTFCLRYLNQHGFLNYYLSGWILIGRLRIRSKWTGSANTAACGTLRLRLYMYTKETITLTNIAQQKLTGEQKHKYFCIFSVDCVRKAYFLRAPV